MIGTNTSPLLLSYALTTIPDPFAEEFSFGLDCIGDSDERTLEEELTLDSFREAFDSIRIEVLITGLV